MINRILKKNNKGMTLVEVVVTLVIFSIIVGVASSMILSSGDMVSRNAEIDTEKYIGDSVFSFIENRVKYATHLRIAEPPYGGTSDALYVEASGESAGRLMYKDGPYSSSARDIYGGNFYFNHTIKIKASIDGSDSSVLILTVEVLRDGETEPSYIASAPIKLTNLDIEGSSLTADAAAAVSGYENPTLVFDVYELMPGTYSDEAVNEVSIRADILIKQRNLLYSLYKKGDPAAKQRIIDLFTVGNYKPANENPGDGFYYSVIKQNLGGQWPAFDRAKLAANPSINNLFSGSGFNNIRVRTYITMKNGAAYETLYYAVKSPADSYQWYALLIFNTRDDCWYAYNQPTGAEYKGKVIDYLSSSSGVSELLDEVETSSSWIKLG